MNGSDNYQLLIAKLDQFIRKFYINGLIRGVLYTVGAVLLLFLAITLAENYFYFDKATRKLLWYSFIGLSVAATSFWVLVPLAHYFRLGKVISHERAAAIIGDHFSGVQDKLLNVLQLQGQAGSQADASLIRASINQKAAEISPVPFRSAIDLSNNRRYLKYALPPLLLLIVIMVASPAWITDGTRRLVNNNEEFERPAPFKFTVTNPELQVVQFADFPLTIRVEGDILPNEVFIEIDNYQYRLQKVAPNEFTYRFAGVRQDVVFRLFSGRVKSKAYELSVLKKPNIVNFNVRLDYPAYLGRTDEVLSNIGDLSVPVGTRIDWEFTTENTDHIDLFFSGDETAEIERAGQDRFLFKRRANRDEQYRLVVSNDRLPRADSMAYSLNVVPDLYPEISVEKFIDSTDSKLLYFVGDAADDHGLTRLNFVYTLKRAQGGDAQPRTVSILKPTGKQTRYDYVWDLRELAPQPGDELSYYFRSIRQRRRKRCQAFAHRHDDLPATYPR